MASDELTAAPVAVLWDGEPGSKAATQARNGLERKRVRTVGELVARTEAELRDGNWFFGPKCMAEVRRVLTARGLALKGDPQPVGPVLRDARGLPYEVVPDGAFLVIAADSGLRLGFREREEFEAAYKAALAGVTDAD